MKTYYYNPPYGLVAFRNIIWLEAPATSSEVWHIHTVVDYVPVHENDWDQFFIDYTTWLMKKDG